MRHLSFRGLLVADKKRIGGFCYGGDPPESGCCNTCEEVRQAYDQRVWVFLPETVAQVRFLDLCCSLHGNI